MRHRRTAGHDIGIEAILGISRKLEQAGRALHQGIEPLASAVIGEARAIDVASERKNRLQIPAEIESQFRDYLISAIGDWGNESELRRPWSEAFALAFQKFATYFLEDKQRLANAFANPLDVSFLEHLGAMPGDSDGKDEWDSRRAAVRQFACGGLDDRGRWNVHLLSLAYVLWLGQAYCQFVDPGLRVMLSCSA
jgi:hypothetical protein